MALTPNSNKTKIDKLVAQLKLELGVNIDLSFKESLSKVAALRIDEDLDTIAQEVKYILESYNKNIPVGLKTNINEVVGIRVYSHGYLYDFYNSTFDALNDLDASEDIASLDDLIDEINNIDNISSSGIGSLTVKWDAYHIATTPTQLFKLNGIEITPMVINSSDVGSYFFTVMSLGSTNSLCNLMPTFDSIIGGDFSTQNSDQRALVDSATTQQPIGQPAFLKKNIFDYLVPPTLLFGALNSIEKNTEKIVEVKDDTTNILNLVTIIKNLLVATNKDSTSKDDLLLVKDNKIKELEELIKEKDNALLASNKSTDAFVDVFTMLDKSINDVDKKVNALVDNSKKNQLKGVANDPKGVANISEDITSLGDKGLNKDVLAGEKDTFLDESNPEASGYLPVFDATGNLIDYKTDKSPGRAINPLDGKVIIFALTTFNSLIKPNGKYTRDEASRLVYKMIQENPEMAILADKLKTVNNLKWGFKASNIETYDRNSFKIIGGKLYWRPSKKRNTGKRKKVASKK